MRPAQGDWVTHAGWNGEYFLVTRVGITDEKPTIWISDSKGEEWPYPADDGYEIRPA